MTNKIVGQAGVEIEPTFDYGSIKQEHKDVVLDQPSKYSFVKLNELGHAINFKEKY